MSDNKGINENTGKPVGKLSWVLFDEATGHIKASGLTMNQVQDAHKTSTATQCDSSPAQASGLYQYMDVSGSAIPASSATDLTSPVLGAGARQAVTSSTSASNVVTTIATFAAGVATGTIVSAGMYTLNTSGTMMCCAACGVTKGAGDALTLTWAVTFN